MNQGFNPRTGFNLIYLFGEPHCKVGGKDFNICLWGMGTEFSF